MNDFTSGTQFDFTYAPGTSQEQILGFEMAGEVWSSLLADDVTVRIHVESTSDLPDEVIGAALPGKKQKSKYEEVGSALLNDISNNYYNNIESQNDITAFNNLPSYDEEFSIIIDGQELDENKDLKLTNANAKSLGLLGDEADKLDGYILVNDLSGNSSVGWDYDALRSGSASRNDMDFLSVAMHEIGHVLGFVSGIDDNEWLKTLAEIEEKIEKKREEGKDDEIEIKKDDFKFVSVLDLYRYNYSDNNPPSGKIDLSMGGNPYFSIDGGETNLGHFASGEDGDGYQASHWKHDFNQGIMDPVLPRGQRRDISDLDLTAFDVIGWDINTAPAPSWDELYENAVAGVETANIQERDKDIDKLIQESGYDITRRSRRSRYSSFRNYSFQLDGFWQLTTLDTVDTSEAIEAIVSDAPIVETEPEVVTENNIARVETETNFIVSNNTTIAEQNVVTVDAPTVETEPYAASEENDDIAQAEVEIIENSNLELIDNNAIALSEPIIESEPEIVVYNETEVQPDPIVETDNIQPANIETLNVNETTVTEPVIEQEDLTVVNNITENSFDSSLAIDPNQSLVNTNLNEGLVVTEEIEMDNDNAIELAAVEAEYYATNLPNNYDEDDETGNSYGYNPNNSYTAPQSVTGVVDRDRDSLFYTNYW